jgi:flagellar assembly factor FliW
MSQALTKHFGTVEYDEAAVITFPSGLPAFERLHRFLLIEQPAAAPLVFLQSLDEAGICLPAIAVMAVDRNYELSLTSEDLEELDFTSSEQPPGATSIACFVVVSIPPGGRPTANLLAPIVINLAARVAVQSVRSDTRYSHQHPIVSAPEGEAVCS